MKVFSTVLLASLLASASTVYAGVVVGGTRLIYDGAKKETSLSVNNPDKMPYLIQSWVESISEGGEKPPFMVTPPLFRLNGGQENVLRVVRAGGHLPENKESMYWMNIKSIPAAKKDDAESQNTLQIAIKTRIKLIYRPAGLNGSPEDMANKLNWQRNGNNIQVSNPTPFYMNFQEVKIAGKEVTEATYVAPGATVSFTLPAGTQGNRISWKIINDYGSSSKEHVSTL
ncbi:periplasmic pilin chaperone (lpfB-like) [Enterobacterales bacterium 8AC]|nr:periplasmic pilin chaperone (lpfB-like) [Enterobacterales bacterium 8AC]